MKKRIIIQSPHDRTTVKNVQRVVQNITRDKHGNETGTVRIDKLTYQVSRNGNTWFGNAA